MTYLNDYKNNENLNKYGKPELFIRNTGYLEDKSNELTLINNISEYNNIEITLHYEEKKGHDGLSQEEALNVIYKILNI